ncbi:MAG: tRNA (guanosine(46)-N7)-methyltransferase TrmB [Thermoguttaceae bacterium]
MGRRALRKLNPSIDLSQHLKTFEQLPCPWDASAIFGRSAPLQIEVGSGNGLFLRTAAAACPDVEFIGIEVVKKYAEFTAASLAKLGLPNARIAMADALRIFSELIPDNALAAVHVYFPDPWWKKRHRKRRVLRESFLRDVERTLRPGGSLHFWTDVEEYFQSTLELIPTCTTLEGPLPVPETPAEHDMAYRTHFERRVRLANEPVYRAEFRKTLRL